MIEAEVEGTVKNKAKLRGWVVRKVSWVGRRGAPDHVFFKAGRCVFIEFKRPGKRVEGQQSKEFRRLAEEYPEVYQVDNIVEGLRILGIEDA